MLRYLAAFCYRAFYLLHHRLCLKPGQPLRHARLVVVGSYRTGGAGKTPFCIWLVEFLVAQGKSVAVLCHRYAYDEVELLRRKFENFTQVEIVSTDNRYRAAHRLDKTCRYDFVLCDDGFEDSRLTGAMSFILSWGNVPRKWSELWPAGNAKSLECDHSAQDAFEICCSGESADVGFVIDKITDLREETLSVKDCGAVHLFCALGNPERFCRDVENYGICIARKNFLRDHDRSYAKRLVRAMRRFPSDMFLISEKDAARLQCSPEWSRYFATGLELLRRVCVALQKTTVKESVQKKIQRQLLYFDKGL